MKTRNKGQEFVKDRLRLMCADLATWDLPRCSAVLPGKPCTTRWIRSRILEPEPVSPSRSRPIPRSPSVRWWVLRISPVIHQIHRIGVTPGAYPYNALHPRLMVLPVSSGRVTPARLRTVLRSHPYRRVVDEVGKAMERGSLSSDIFVSELADEKAILREKGVRRLLLSPSRRWVVTRLLNVRF